MKRIWMAAPVATAALVGGAYIIASFALPKAVSVESLRAKPGPTESSAARKSAARERAQGTLRVARDAALSPEEVEAFYQADPDLRTVDGASIIEKLESESSLTEHEKLALERAFKTASHMQSGIDAETSTNLRELYQRRVIEQLELRLKLVLADPERVKLARAECAGCRA